MQDAFPIHGAFTAGSHFNPNNTDINSTTSKVTSAKLAEINKKYEEISQLQESDGLPNGPNCIGFACYANGLMPYIRYIEPNDEMKAMIRPEAIVPLDQKDEYLAKPGTMIILFNNKDGTDINHGALVVSDDQGIKIMDKPGPSSKDKVQIASLAEFLESGLRDTLYSEIKFVESFDQGQAGKYAMLLKPNELAVPATPHDPVAKIEKLLPNLHGEGIKRPENYEAIAEACKELPPISDPTTYSVAKAALSAVSYPLEMYKQCVEQKGNQQLDETAQQAVRSEFLKWALINTQTPSAESCAKKLSELVNAYTIPDYPVTDQKPKGMPKKTEKSALTQRQINAMAIKLKGEQKSFCGIM